MQKIVPQNTRLFPIDAKRVYEGIIFDVYHWEQKLYDGSYTTFEGLKRADTVTVIAVVDDQIIVTRDEQPHRAPVITEPGGRVDDTDESTLAAAQRELLEETGYSFAEWRLVDVIRPQEKMEYFMYTYLAYGSHRKVDQKQDAGERVELRLVSFKDIKQLISSGDAPRLAGQKVLRESKNFEELIATPEYKGMEITAVPKREVRQG